MIRLVVCPASGSRLALGSCPALASRLALASCLALVASLVGLALAPMAVAQGPATVPELPSGGGTLKGRVVHPTGPVAGAEVVVYALMSDGTPGVSRRTSDEDGSFVLEGVNAAPDTVYLVAVSYRGVPFGQRLAFEAGESTLETRIEVSDPIQETDAARVAETRLLLTLAAGGVDVRVSQRLEYDGEAVVYVEPEARDAHDPILTAALPADARNYQSLTASAGDGLERSGSELEFWGPLYPDGQAMQYAFQLPAEGRELRWRERFPSGTNRLVVAVPDDGSELSSPQLRADEVVESEGLRFRTWVADGVAPGAAVELALTLPPMREDAGALALEQANVWAELDDAELVVTTEVAFAVSPGAALVGGPDAPLLEVGLPDGAELLGVSPEVAALGAERGGTGFQLLGPVPPGEHRISYRYRLPSTSTGAELAFAFSKPLPLLSVLVADTGLVVETDRLHRRRPARSGTRTYLRREAFQLAAGETIALGFRPLQADATPRWLPLTLVVALGLASVWLVAAPLRRREQAEEVVVEPGTEFERQLVYATIRDLDHDYETGKIAEDDYRTEREKLRARAVALLRAERVHEGSATPTLKSDAASERDAPSRGRFCSGCGDGVDPTWKFCSSCGAELTPPSEGSRESRA